MSAVTVGMAATISINYGSTSETTQTKITDSFKVSEGLESVSGAVSTSTSDSTSSSYFTFSMIHYGGGTAAANDLNDAFAQTNAAGDAYYALCAAGDSGACTTFTSNMGTGAINALSSLDELVDGLSGASSPDISFFDTFPNGVAGPDLPALVTTDIPLTSNDVLDPYTSQLDQYVALLNQIATLNNRTVALNAAVSEPMFDPTILIDLVSYLDRLENVYKVDRRTLLTNLEACLAATSANVTTVCAPIIDNTVTNAFEWYASSGANPNFFAQQNTLALQYTTNSRDDEPVIPLDVIYIDELPSFAAAGFTVPIAGEAAFVGFADRAWVKCGLDADGCIAGTFFTTVDAMVKILALEPGEPISTSNVSTKIIFGSDPLFFEVWHIDFDDGISPDGAGYSFTTVACTPTFDDPCAIDYEGEFDDVTFLITNQQIEGLFTAD